MTFAFIILLLLHGFGSSFGGRKIKIGIVGGGIGGTSNAYFLRESLKDRVEIDVFEPGHIGGRLATTTVNDLEYEVGGSVIHPKNRYMIHFRQLLELSEREGEDNDDLLAIVGLNREILFREYPYIGTLQLLYRYGLFTLLKLYYFISSILGNFDQIYPFLEDKNGVENVEDLLRAMAPKSKNDKNPQGDAILDLTDESINETLIEQGMNQLFSDELAAAAMRCNYGQSPSKLHAFVGAVSLAGAQPGLWAIKGGNHKVPEGLLQKSSANLIRAKVLEITFDPKSGGNYTIKFVRESHSSLYNEGSWNGKNKDNKLKNEQLLYDVIVIATPLTSDKSSIKFIGFNDEKDFEFPGKFHRTVATIVRGDLNPEFFGYGYGTEGLPSVFFFIDPKDKLNSLGKLVPVNYSSSSEGDSPVNDTVWKVFSQSPMTEEELDSMFLRIHEPPKIFDWLAYPDYSPHQKGKLGRFKLHDNLYHINGIEWAASAMEMSVLGAKNVANLIYKNFMGSQDFHNKHSDKEEL